MNLGWAAAAQNPPLELVVLGSGGPGATGRAGSCYLVLLDGAPRIVVDAGPGSFVRLGEAKLSLDKTDIVLLTHLHIDHTGEIPGLFKARAVSSDVAVIFNVWGPDGTSSRPAGATFPSTSQFLNLLFGAQGAYSYLRDFSAPLSIVPHDLPSASATVQVIRTEDRLSVSAIGGHHGDAPAIIYRIDYAGRSVVFSGDIDAQGLSKLRTLARGADLLVFNAAVLDPPQSPAILYTLHTPPRAIGEVAKAAGVRRVLLSHLSPATEKMADAVLASIHHNFAGPVSLAADGIRLQP